MAGQLGQIFVNLADNLMVGRLGAASLAAVSLANAIFICFFVIGMGISFALPPLIAQADGANESTKMSQYFKHSLINNLIFAFLAILLIELGLPLLYNLGQDPEVVQLAIPYLRITGWSILPFMIFQTLRCYSDGRSETLPPMIAMIIGNVINIFLNFGFIYGKWGFPALGVQGAALGTLIARIAMIIVLIGIMMYWKDIWDQIKNANYLKYQKRLFNKVWSLGIPTSLQMFFEVSAFAGAAILMGKLGKIPQAAHQIVINLASMTFLICTGLAMAATIRVGNQIGKHQYIGVKNAGFSAIIQVFVFMAFTAILFIVGRNFFPTFYIDDKEVLKIATVLMLMSALFQIPDGVQVAALGSLRGMQDVKIPTLITFVAYWIFGIPISYITAFIYDWGPIGIWAGLVFGLSISAGLLTYRFQQKTNKLIIG